jgi:DNA-binding MarR family transcriptional regulator
MMRNVLPIMQAAHASPRHAALGNVFVVAQHLDRLGDVVLAPLGLTTKQWLLLAVVQTGFAGRRPTLTEAAALYGSSRQNVKAIAAGLEGAGYLRIVRDPADRRALRLVVTDRVAVFASPEWRAREAAFLSFAFGDLQPDEIARLADLLERWLAGIATWPDEHAPAQPAGPAGGPDHPAPTSVVERSIP